MDFFTMYHNFIRHHLTPQEHSGIRGIEIGLLCPRVWSHCVLCWPRLPQLSSAAIQ